MVLPASKHPRQITGPAQGPPARSAPGRAVVLGTGVLCAPLGTGLAWPAFGLALAVTEFALTITVVCTALFGSDRYSDRAFRLLSWMLNRPESARRARSRTQPSAAPPTDSTESGT